MNQRQRVGVAFSCGQPCVRRSRQPRHWLTSVALVWALGACATPSAQAPEAPAPAVVGAGRADGLPHLVAPTAEPGSATALPAAASASTTRSATATAANTATTASTATAVHCSGKAGVRARQRCEAQKAERAMGADLGQGMARDVKSTERSPSPPQLELQRRLALGEAALLREDYDAAAQAFRDARRLVPTAAAPLVGLVQARVGQLGLPSEYAGASFDPKFKELLGLLDDALKFEPEFGQAHLERGRLLLVAGDSQAAHSSLLRAVALLPVNAEAHSALAVVYLTQGNVSEALGGFQRASDLEPHSAERLTNLGTAFMMQGDVQQAISAYHRAVGLAPNDARSRGDLGTALLAVNDAHSALPHLRRAQELAPARATFMSNLGYAYQRLANQPAAEQWYRRAVAADPKLGSAWINLGTLQAAQKKFDAAESSFLKALKIDPEDPRALANLAELRALR